MRNSFRRLSIGRTGGGITLGEKLDAGRSCDPTVTDPTERSISSSVCLSDSGKAIVVSAHVMKKSVPYPASPASTSLSPPDDQQIEICPKKPHSQRRRSIFGSSSSSHGSIELTPESNSEMEDKPKSQRRQSLFGGSAHSTKGASSAGGQHGRQSQQKIEAEEFDKPESAPRRRSLFSSTSFNHEPERTDGSDLERPRSVRPSGKGIAPTSSSNHTSSVSDQDCSVDDVSSTNDVSSTKKPPRSSARRNSLKNSNGNHHSHTSDDVLRSPKKPSSRRRYSLTGCRDSSGVDCVPASPQKPRSHRRGSMLGISSHETKLTCDVAKDDKTSVRGKELQKNGAILTNPYDLLNKERARRSLPPFSRNMLMDTIARDIALQLAKSDGTKCTATDYYGNVGKGVDLITIHRKMMAQCGTEKGNIVSSKFSQVGIGISKSSDGQIFLCQLFQ